MPGCIQILYPIHEVFPSSRGDEPVEKTGDSKGFMAVHTEGDSKTP